jgi:hypothetical protein
MRIGGSVVRAQAEMLRGGMRNLHEVDIYIDFMISVRPASREERDVYHGKKSKGLK